MDLISQMAQSLAHLGKCEFGFVAQAEQSFGASHFFARASYLKNLVRSHGVRSRLAGIAAEGAIAAVVATQVGERNKNFARVGYDPRLEALPGLHGSC